MFYLVLLAAIFISGIAGFISISGLMAIFPGSPWIVALMGGALELGKLVTASWVYRFWKKAGWFKHYFVLAVTILSLITSIGIFGFLSKAHIEGGANESLNTGRIELIDQRITAESLSKASDTRVITQIDESVSRLLANDRVSSTNGAVAARTRQRAERTAVLKSIADHDQKILDLRTERSALSVEKTKIDADVGPIKYVAQTLFGKDDRVATDRATRWLTLVLVLVFDPLAILLFIAAGITRSDRLPVETTNPPPVETDIPLDEIRSPDIPESDPLLEPESDPLLENDAPRFESPGVDVYEVDPAIRSFQKTRDILKTKQEMGRA